MRCSTIARHAAPRQPRRSPARVPGIVCKALVADQHRFATPAGLANAAPAVAALSFLDHHFCSLTAASSLPGKLRRSGEPHQGSAAGFVRPARQLPQVPGQSATPAAGRTSLYPDDQPASPGPGWHRTGACLHDNDSHAAIESRRGNGAMAAIRAACAYCCHRTIPSSMCSCTPRVRYRLDRSPVPIPAR